MAKDVGNVDIGDGGTAGKHETSYLQDIAEEDDDGAPDYDESVRHNSTRILSYMRVNNDAVGDDTGANHGLNHNEVRAEIYG